MTDLQLNEQTPDAAVTSGVSDSTQVVVTADDPIVNSEHEPLPSEDTELTYFIGNTVKTISMDGNTARVGGYLCVWGNAAQKDLQGEYFTPRTELGLDWYPERPALFHHTLDKTIKTTKLGMIDTLKADSVGLWAEAVLDLRNRYIQKIKELVDQGVLGWSSGTVPHWADVADDGEIKRWIIVEGSLTPAPAEPRRTSIQSIKSEIIALDDAEINTPIEPGTVKEASEIAAEVTRALAENSYAPGGVNSLPNQEFIYRGVEMSVKMDTSMMIAAMEKSGVTSDQIIEVMKELGAAEVAEPEGVMADPAATPDVAPPDEMPPTKSAAKAFNAKELAIELLHQFKTAPANISLPGVDAPMPNQPSPRITDMRTPYYTLNAEDMSFMSHWMRGIASKSHPVSYEDPLPPEFYKEMIDKAQRGVDKLDLPYEGKTGVKSLLAIKTNELDNTGNATAAGNWVPELWYSQLWRRVRVENEVASQFQNIEMPSATFDLPVESTDPTVYKVPETTNDAQLSLASGAAIPDSVVSASKVQLVAAKMALRIGFSTEMEEDSIIPFIPQLRDQALRTMQNAIDNVLLNGDTDATINTNINYIDGTPGSTQKFLVFNGLRKLPLITNTALKLDALGATPTLQMMRSLRFKMRSALNVYANRPADLCWFVDVPTYGKMLNIDELLVFMNNGRGSTVNDGGLPTIDGSPVYASAELLLANSAGKVDVAQDGTLGQAILVAKPAWYVGYRRNITTSIDFLPYYDSYQMTATVRLAFINKDTIASAEIYNISVS
jgi:hypothetical protein